MKGTRDDDGPLDRRRPGRGARGPRQPGPAAHRREAGRRPRLREPPGPRARREPSPPAHAPPAARSRWPRRRQPRAVGGRQGHEVLRGGGARPAPDRIDAGRGGPDPDQIGPGAGSRTQGAALMDNVTWPEAIVVLGIIALIIFLIGGGDGTYLALRKIKG